MVKKWWTVLSKWEKAGKKCAFYLYFGNSWDYYPCTSDGWGALVKADDIIGKPITMNEMKQVLELHGIFPRVSIEGQFEEETAEASQNLLVFTSSEPIDPKKLVSAWIFIPMI